MKSNGRLTAKVAHISIEGFRSLAHVNVPLSDLNVIIGANGSGKSNFIKFFELLSWTLASKGLGDFVERNGGADDQLFGGNKKTPRLSAEIQLRTDKGRNDYRFSLSHGSPDRFFFSEEAYRYNSKERKTQARWIDLESGHREAEIVNRAKTQNDSPELQKQTAKMIVNFLLNCATYQFHDTSAGSPLKIPGDADDVNYMRSHGGNVAPILLWLRENDLKRYELICKQISRILPVFDGFELNNRYGKVALRWRNKHIPDKTMGAHLTSDGSLRLFALITLLNLPKEMLPDVILLDEPELGLHPAGIALIGSMIRGLSQEKQVIVATQSPLLVDAFDIDEIIVAECNGAESSFTPKRSEDYSEWLEDNFKAGDLWLKNILGGRP